MQIKLDELIIRLEGAREELLDLEELDEADLTAIRWDFCSPASRAREKAKALKRTLIERKSSRVKACAPLDKRLLGRVAVGTSRLTDGYLRSMPM
jgi:hypothetical protein